MKNIALIYGTRHEGTTGIAEKIAETLIQNGFKVVLQNITNKFDSKNFFRNDFAGFILGSGIQMGKWTPGVKKFIVKNRGHFTKDGVKLGMFVSCGTAHSSDASLKACTEYVDFFAKDLGVTPDITAAFGGIYDFSKNSNLNFAIKFVLKSVVKKETPGQFDLNNVNDFRNWDDVVTFANNFSALF